MLFWILFCCFIFLFFGKYRVGTLSKFKYTNLLGIIFIILISAIRFDVGWDYSSYYRLVFPWLNLEQLKKVEPICRQIILLTDYVRFPPLMFIIFSILTYGIAGYAILKYSSDKYLSILIYLSFFYLSTLSVIRQGFAISLIMLAFPFLQNKNYAKYLILTILAVLTHYSSFIAISIMFLYIITTKKNYVLIVLLSLACLFSIKIIVEKFMPAYMVYVINASGYEGGSMMMWLMIGISTTLSIFSLIKKNKYLVRCSCISLIGSFIPLFLGGQIGGRVASYFYIPLVFAIPQLFILYKSKICRNLSIVFLYLLFILVIFVDYNNPIKSSLTPYKTIFTENINNPKFKN